MKSITCTCSSFLTTSTAVYLSIRTFSIVSTVSGQSLRERSRGEQYNGHRKHIHVSGALHVCSSASPNPEVSLCRLKKQSKESRERKPGFETPDTRTPPLRTKNEAIGDRRLGHSCRCCSRYLLTSACGCHFLLVVSLTALYAFRQRKRGFRNLSSKRDEEIVTEVEEMTGHAEKSRRKYSSSSIQSSVSSASTKSPGREVIQVKQLDSVIDELRAENGKMKLQLRKLQGKLGRAETALKLETDTVASMKQVLAESLVSVAVSSFELVLMISCRREKGRDSREEKLAS